MKYIMILMLISAVILTACASTDVPVDVPACTEEAKVCSDGSTVVRDANNNCEFPACPENPNEGKLQAIDCTDPRPEVCSTEIGPVCGQVQVQCIRAPCDPIMQTFSNKCLACANSLTISYVEGVCAGDPIAPNVSKQMDCLNRGGQYHSELNECEGITAEQCQEIGGTFNECASACRNDPTAEICTMQCVPICEMK